MKLKYNNTQHRPKNVNLPEHLPRSIRWRIHLGLLQFDFDQANDATSTTNNTTASNTNSTTTSQQMIYYDEQEIQSKNQSLISNQRQRYDSLSGKHHKNSSAIEIIHDSEQQTSHNVNKASNPSPSTAFTESKNASKSKSYSQSNQKHIIIPSNTIASTANSTNNIEDPLSVFAKIQEVETKSEKQKEIELKKERALAARSQYSIVHHQHHLNPTGDTKKIMNKIQHHHHHKEENDKVGQRWREFYSSREMMDIINRDVNRLPQAHQVVAFFTKMKLSCQIHHTHPLETGNYGTTNVKDIHFNLEHEISVMKKYLDGANDQQDDDDNDDIDLIINQCRNERSTIISQILFVYAKEYPIIGYRQGMHEILSLIFLCLEIDLLEARINDTNNINPSSRQQSQQSKQIVVHQLFDSSKIANDAFTIFEAIMSKLSTAFEVRGNNDVHQPSSLSPMEIIGNSIVGKIRSLARDEELYQLISSLSIPSEIYLTRWIRLMFSREVKGISNVYLLWDELFLQSASSQNYSLIHILECTATSMIVMLRHQLIQPIQQKHQMLYMGVYDDVDDDRDPSDCIHLLMNYPPIEDVTKIIQLNKDIMSGNYFRDFNSTSTQITMGDGSNSSIHLQEDGVMPQSSNNNRQFQSHIYNNNLHADPMINSMPHSSPHGSRIDFRYVDNFSGAQQVKTQGQMNSPAPTNYNPFFAPNNDNFRSTLESISGGLSEGLNAFKGALSSLDQKISIKSYSPFASGNNHSNQQSMSNVYNPGYRQTTNVHQGPNINIGVDGNIRTHNNHNMVQESMYISNYQQHSHIENRSILSDPLQDRDTCGNEHDITTMEDQFIGGGGTNTQISNCSESHQLATRLDSSLLQLSIYLQNLTGRNGETVPQSVWDAMEEINAVKNEMITRYNVPRRT